MNATLLVCALALDAMFGEPKWLWSKITHPVVLMGLLIERLEENLNTGTMRRLNGCIAQAILIAVAFGVAAIVSFIPFSWVIELAVAAILIAHRSLVQHVSDVADALRLSVADGRATVAMIVGRDTASMSSPDVARAAIESAAENFSDGVIAPAFWFLVAGLPGLLIYKLTNTADSMIGYRTERYSEYGWAAARFDDLLNWIPARLTAILFAAIYGLFGQWTDIVKDAGLHRSPNAGWPEAALSRGLNVALAGPRNYDGVRQDYPFVNPTGERELGPNHIAASTKALRRGWVVFTLAILLVATVDAAI